MPHTILRVQFIGIWDARGTVYPTTYAAPRLRGVLLSGRDYRR